MPLSTDNGLFLPNTATVDGRVLNKDVTIQDLQEQLFLLQFQYYNNIANVVNLKDSGFYVPVEFVTGQQWFRNDITQVQNPLAFGWRLVVNFGALPNAGAKSVPHNITGLIAGEYSWTKIMGTATDAAGNGIPLPFASPTLNENIKLTVDITNVTVTTAIDYSAFTHCVIVLEYIKDDF